MKENICPKCGALLDKNKNTICCRVCGYSLSDDEALNISCETYADSVTGENRDGETAEQSTQLDFYDLWRKRKSNDYHISVALSFIALILLFAMIALAIGFLIHLIVRGIQINNALTMFDEFDGKTIKFTSSIAALLLLHIIFDTVSDCYELMKCPAWLREHNVDIAHSEMVVTYKTLSKKGKDNYFNYILLAYCVEHGEQVRKSIMFRVLYCLIDIAFYITAGIFCAIAINNFILSGTDFFTIGYIVGAIAAAGIPSIVIGAIDKAVLAPVVNWALTQ